MTIKEFYNGRHIFITGSTGFMGKTLIEKFVRSCPEIGNIYLLIRHRKGKDIKSRVQEMLDSPLFDTIKKLKPGFVESKLFPILGDMRMLRMGLSDSDYSMLVENVSVIFHVAATVRFDESFKDATIMNVRGTREIVLLAKQMKNLTVFLHVSTSYCNCNRTYVEEKLYEPPINWRDAISIAENQDEKSLNIITKKLLGEFPNTYTFTKLLAEHIINDEKDNVPMVIIRPTIVMSTIKEPVPGWIDNFNGPVGLMLAGGKGFVKISFSDKEGVPDYVPVDVSIKAMIVTAWHRATQNSLEMPTLPIYHTATGSKSISNGELIQYGLESTLKYPHEEMIWRPNISLTLCFYYYYIVTVLQQVIPAMFIDWVFKITGKKSKKLLDLQRKIYLVTLALSSFLIQSWTFTNHNFLGLLKEIPEIDREDFNYDISGLVKQHYIEDCHLGMRKFLLKTDPNRLTYARKNLKRFILLDRIIKAVLYTIFLYCFLKSGIPTKYFQRFYSFLE